MSEDNDNPAELAIQVTVSPKSPENTTLFGGKEFRTSLDRGRQIISIGPPGYVRVGRAEVDAWVVTVGESTCLIVVPKGQGRIETLQDNMNRTNEERRLNWEEEQRSAS